MRKCQSQRETFFTVRDILKEYTGEEIRFFLLSGHYRSPINFSRDLMIQSRNALARMHHAEENLRHLKQHGEGEMTEKERSLWENISSFRGRFEEAMEDDLNTADAISAVFELIREVNTAVRDGASGEFAGKCLDLLKELTGILGILSDGGSEEDGISEEIKALVEERQEARKAKNFARADEIRDILREKGLAVEDTPQGPKIVKL